MDFSKLSDDELQKELVQDAKFTPCNQAARDERKALYKEVDKRRAEGKSIVY